VLTDTVLCHLQLRGRSCSSARSHPCALPAQGGIYNLPSHLSPGARDLIPRMLLVDPLKRITIPELRQHPWFTLHLPRYLAVMQVPCDGRASARGRRFTAQSTARVALVTRMHAIPRRRQRRW
jgi:hypothetical protein